MFLKSVSSDGPVRIRMEDLAAAADVPSIRAVHEAAFGGCEEADLVDNLRANGALVSMVAESELGIVGHILFSRMWIQTPSQRVAATALAPVGVLPECQRKGIGGRLIAEGLEWLRQREECIVIVVGHPSYYPRFGFSTGKAALLESPFPREAFLALELVEGALAGVHGPVVYPPAFGL